MFLSFYPLFQKNHKVRVERERERDARGREKRERRGSLHATKVLEDHQINIFHLNLVFQVLRLVGSKLILGTNAYLEKIGVFIRVLANL